MTPNIQLDMLRTGGDDGRLSQTQALTQSCEMPLSPLALEPNAESSEGDKEAGKGEKGLVIHS